MSLSTEPSTKYVADFICTYKFFEEPDDPNEPEMVDEQGNKTTAVHDCDVMYRIQLIQACNCNDDMDEMNKVLDELYENIHNTSWCSVILNKLMRNSQIGMDYDVMFRTLFGYEYFHLFHACLCEFFHNGIVNQSRVDAICAVIE